MYKIEDLIEKAYENNRTILSDDAIEFCLVEEDYNKIVSLLQEKGITVKKSDVDMGDSFFTDDTLKQYLKEIGKFPLLSLEEERQLFLEYKKTSDLEIRKKIINSNLRLVVKIARQYNISTKGFKIELLDLIQEGNEGLMKAVDRFDITLGNRFATYAGWWIKSSILKYMSSGARTIRIPHNFIDNYSKYKKYIDLQLKNTGIKPSTSELADVFEQKKEYIEKIISTMENPVISLDEELPGDSKTMLIETFPSNEPLLEDYVINDMKFEYVEEIMQQYLTPNEYAAISIRYGLVNEFNNCSSPKTLEETGDIMRITRERVRQLEQKAMGKMKIKVKRWH